MKEKKISFFRRFINFINRRYESKNEYEDIGKENIFERYINIEDLTDLTYNDVKVCADYCYEALKLAEKRLRILSNSEKMTEQLLELEYLEHLTESDIDKLNILCTRHKNLIKENKTLLYQLTGFSNAIGYLKNNYKQAENSIGIIEEAEKNQRIFKSDINLLKYEKSEVAFDNVKLNNAMSFINKLSIGVVVIFSVMTLILGYLNIFNNRPMFYEVATIAIFLIFFISLTYFFRIKINKEIKKNIKIQSKITLLINKKKAVYAYYTSFLDVEYDKYNAKNSKDLKYNLDEYKQYEKIAQRKDTASRAYQETLIEIENFIKEKGIPCNTSIDVFVKNVSVEDRIKQRKKLIESKKESENLLEDLDTKHKAYWNLIVELSEKDETNNKVIKRLIEKYYEEVEKVLMRLSMEKRDSFIEDEIDTV